MRNTSEFIRPVLLTLTLVSLAACGASVNAGSYYPYGPYYPYEYPWHYTPYGTFTIVRRPILVVDGWTSRAFGYRPYRGYAIRRHNSPVTVYTATKGNRTYEVNLTPLGDSTRVEVRALRGEKKYDKEQAKLLLGLILEEYK